MVLEGLPRPFHSHKEGPLVCGEIVTEYRTSLEIGHHKARRRRREGEGWERRRREKEKKKEKEKEREGKRKEKNIF